MNHSSPASNGGQPLPPLRDGPGAPPQQPTGAGAAGQQGGGGGSRGVAGGAAGAGGEGTLQGRGGGAGFLGGKAPRRLASDPNTSGHLPPPSRTSAPHSLTPASPAPPTTSSQSSAGAGAQPTTVFPALHLTPLNGTFVPKQISLDPPGTRVKVGRQTNAKTIPNGTNGYFDSKVLSRMHAEVWSEDGKVFIKDVKSSNGTFINGERLSPESSESDVFELHTDDVVEFGIDILTEDTKTIVHHKVAAKVHLVLNADDAAASSREINNWYRSANEQQAQQQQQQQQQQHQRGGQRPGGRPGGGTNGLSFEHVLSRLQGELQKSRDTGANLTDVNSTLTTVHDTLGGGAPPSIPPGAGIPGRSTSAFPPRTAPPNPEHAQSIAQLQAQLADTQSSLAGHVGKIRDLEGLLAEHEVIKREVGALRRQIEEAQEGMVQMLHEREKDAAVGGMRGGRESPIAALLEAQEEADAAEAGDDDVDFDDAASVSSVDTIAPSRRPNGIAAAKKKELKRDVSLEQDETTDAPPSSPPPAPTPALSASPSTAGDAAAAAQAEKERSALLADQNAKLVARLEALSAELDEATKLGAQLREQHAAASVTIRALEERIKGLEGKVREVERGGEERWDAWRGVFEEGWRVEREGWEREREGLRRVVREWEEGKERERREREERRARRDERRERRKAARAARDDDKEEGSESSGEEEDDEADDSDDEEDDDATPAPPSPSKRTSPSSRSKAQRKRSASPSSPTSSSFPPSSATSAGSTLAQKAATALPASISPSSVDNLLAGAGSGGGAASDSDSTIGERRKGGVSAGGAERAHGGKGGQGEVRGGETKGQQPPQGLPFSLAGAVVVIAVAVGYGAAMKLKE
ncbi:hypothetical protein JCM6882_000400 [Rhodosporidiobolus microsporus]